MNINPTVPNVEPVLPVASTTPPPQMPAISQKNIGNSMPLLAIIFGGIILLLVGGIGGWYLATTQTAMMLATVQPVVTNTPIPAPTTTPIGSPTINPEKTIAQTAPSKVGWVKATLPTLGLEFDVPPQVAALGKMTEEIAPGDTGTMYCIRFVKQTSNSVIPQVYASSYTLCTPSTPNGLLILGTTSFDFVGGSDGSFDFMQGFDYKNGQYQARFTLNRVWDFPSEAIITKVENPNGVEIITIDGTNIKEENGPSLMNELVQNTGVLINTRNATYPGLAMVIQGGGLTPEEIDQMLKSVRFTQ